MPVRRLTLTFTLLFLVVFAIDAYPGLRGGGGWRWSYALPESWAAVGVLALILALYFALLWWMRRKVVPVAVVLAVMVVAGTLVTLAAVSVRGGAGGGAGADTGFVLFTRTVSPVQTGASTVAVHVLATDGLQASLDRWPDVMREAKDRNIIHFSTSPPGQALLHYYAADVLDRYAPDAIQPLNMRLRWFQCSNDTVMAYTRGEMVSAGLGLLMPFAAALAVIPLYAAASLLTDRRSALVIAGWWPLVPTVALFAPTWNTVYPALGVTAFALLLAGLHASRGRFALYTFAAGAVMSLATFLNFAVLPLLLLYGLFTLGETWRRRDPFVRALIAGAWFGVGLSVVWLAFYVSAGWTPFDLLAVTFEAHSTLVQRDYLPWLLLHPYDVLLFVGWPVAALFAWAVWTAAYAPHRERVHILALAMFITFVAVNLAGIVQGENGRILSFYAPFFLLSAAGVLRARASTWDVPLLAGQALMLLVMAAVLAVVPQDLNDIPPGPRGDVPPLEIGPPNEVGVTFTSEAYPGAVTLTSYRFVADVGAQVITLETLWQGVERSERPYEIEVTARAENEIDGEIVAVQRWQPQNGNYLTTCWRPGDAVRDVTMIELPTISAPVVWRLSVRWVDPRTGDVLAPPDEVILGPVRYP